jgi:hypothetical protein
LTITCGSLGCDGYIIEAGMVFSLYTYFETMINDMTFSGYHKFGSESRILPEFERVSAPRQAARG